MVHYRTTRKEMNEILEHRVKIMNICELFDDYLLEIRKTGSNGRDYTKRALVLKNFRNVRINKKKTIVY